MCSEARAQALRSVRTTGATGNVERDRCKEHLVVAAPESQPILDVRPVRDAAIVEHELKAVVGSDPRKALPIAFGHSTLCIQRSHACL